ncbi:hypothetical protein [Flagellimonas sp. GZD32]|uniref:hypothetical protein n=1 Tax=Flagellimonas cixiensis TaxID=3228750 RepID=UPI0035C8D2B1
MEKILIFSQGAYQKYGHSFDYCKGLSTAFDKMGFEVHIFGVDGPLKFPDNVVEVKINLDSNLQKKQTVLQKINWGFSRIKNYQNVLNSFSNYYDSFHEKPMVLFETFEYFSLANNIKKYKGNCLCIFHDTNFNFKQTSLIAGIYKYLARYPSKVIVKNANCSFVHGNQMKLNFINQIGEKHAHKIENIPYGAPVPIQISETERKNALLKLNLDTTKHYMLSFGTLRSDKEFQPIIEALLKNDNWEWIIAGPEGDISYKYILDLATKQNVSSKIKTFQRFILNEEQRDFFAVADVVVNLYKPFIRHESGTAQLARTYIKPVIVSGPPDLTEYVTLEKIGWVSTEHLSVSKILRDFEDQSVSEKNEIKENIKELALKNAWPTVTQKILNSFKM